LAGQDAAFRFSMKEEIDYYHDLISKPDLLASAAGILNRESQRLTVAGRPTCNVLRPCFLEESTYFFIRKAAEGILKAIGIIGRQLSMDPSLRKELDLTPEEEAVVQIDSGYGAPDVSARLDGFLSDSGEFHFVEYNADSPGGLGYGDVLSEVFQQMPLVREFGKRFPFRTLPIRSFTFNALLKAYRRWGGKGLPNIAIVDWKNAPTLKEFVLFEDFFQARGCQVKIGSPEELQFDGKQVLLNDFPVDLLYKRVIVGELLQKFPLDHSFYQAVRDHAVCMVNGFAVQMLFKKSLFALLSDPNYSSYFDSQTQRLIERHIPWTRKVREMKTTYGSDPVDLIPFISKNRTNMVLKPNGEYGGKGVLLGWECEEAEWQEAVAAALQSSYVVQERVDLGVELYPSLIDGRVSFDERYYDLDPYVWDGNRAEGCGVRLSRLAILNVSAGGGSATPLFILRR
jgi:hypothetical protein